MPLFDLTKKYFSRLGIKCRQSIKILKCVHPINEHNTVFICIYAGAAATTILHLFEDIGFEEYIITVYAATMGMLNAIVFAIIVWKTEKIFKLIENIESVVQTRLNYPKSKLIYDQTIEQVEKWSKYVSVILIVLLCPSLMLPNFIASFFQYFYTDRGNDSFQLPFPSFFGFDINNPIGYTAAYILEYLGAQCMCYDVVAAVSFGIGCYLFSLSVIKDIGNDFLALSEKTKAKQMTYAEIMEQLSNVFELHSTGKQLIIDFMDIYQMIILCLLFWCISFGICGAMFLLQIGITTADPIFQLLSVILLWWSLVLAFIPCELGERVSFASIEAGNIIIEQFDWYKFPNEIQKMLPTILSVVQQPVTLKCFGSISCLREAFKEIINSAFSYFMVLRSVRK